MYQANSYDQAQRPLTNVQYQQAPNPAYNSYGGGDYNGSTAYLNQNPYVAPTPRKRGVSKWVKSTLR